MTTFTDEELLLAWMQNAHDHRMFVIWLEVEHGIKSEKRRKELLAHAQHLFKRHQEQNQETSPYIADDLHFIDNGIDPKLN